MALLVPYTLLATMLVFAILLRTTALDRATAFFSAVPGGVNEMTLMGSERGGHEPSLAVHQSLRLLLVILTVSTIFGLYGVSSVVGGDTVEPGLAWDGYAWILTMAACGAFLAKLARIPAPFILGPMLVSAAIHLFDIVDVKPSSTLVAVAQVVSGAAIGSQFSSFSRRMLYSAGLTAVGIAALLLVFTVGFAYAVSFAVDQPFPVLLLAFAPGGMGEMGLIALSMHADAAFVSASQVFRFFVVVTMAAPLYNLFQARIAR
jgi:membrane AbrB-like protein